MTALERAAAAASAADADWKYDDKLGWGETVARAVLLAVKDLSDANLEVAFLAAEDASLSHADQFWPPMIKAGYVGAIDSILKGSE